MVKRLDLILLAALVITLIPSATSADATHATTPTNRCTAAVQAAAVENSNIAVVRDRQLTALAHTDQRLKNLIDQAAAQNHPLGSISADKNTLDQRTTDLTKSYAALATAVTATGAQCGADTAVATAKSALGVTRNQVTDLTTWYNEHLAADLHQLASTK